MLEAAGWITYPPEKSSVDRPGIARLRDGRVPVANAQAMCPDDLRPNWHFYLGKIAFPARLNSTGFSWVYVGINLFAFAFGIGCIFFGDSWRELGIALIVGAMFGNSAFVAQLLSVQLAVEQHQNDLLWRDARTLKYAPRLAEISEQVQTVREQMKAELGRQPVAGKDGTGNGVGGGAPDRPEDPLRPPGRLAYLSGQASVTRNQPRGLQ